MRRDAQRLNDILEALDWIAKAVARRTEADFVADETLCYAVAQKLGAGQLRHLRRGVSQTGIRLPVAAKSAEGGITGGSDDGNYGADQKTPLSASPEAEPQNATEE